MGIEPQQPTRAGRMSATQFRMFQDGRPDHERWELIAGVPMMMTPPTIAHNRIAGNLESLLNSALSRYLPDCLATQRPGVELSSGDYRPEPDVAIIKANYEADQRFVDHAFLLAEVSLIRTKYASLVPKRSGSTSSAQSISAMPLARPS